MYGRPLFYRRCIIERYSNTCKVNLMSRTLTKQLVWYRSLMLAIANAGITWVILIIAPLGLASVITCTVLVFGASLLNGWISDRALLGLLAAGDRDLMTATGMAKVNLEERGGMGDRTFTSEERKNLPRD